MICTFLMSLMWCFSSDYCVESEPDQLCSVFKQVIVPGTVRSLQLLLVQGTFCYRTTVLNFVPQLAVQWDYY